MKKNSSIDSKIHPLIERLFLNPLGFYSRETLVKHYGAMPDGKNFARYEDKIPHNAVKVQMPGGVEDAIGAFYEFPDTLPFEKILHMFGIYSKGTIERYLDDVPKSAQQVKTPKFLNISTPLYRLRSNNAELIGISPELQFPRALYIMTEEARRSRL